MKIISFNANGIRSAAQKGFYTWLEKQHADFVCIQETKAQKHQLEGNADFFPLNYHCEYYDAIKKGYSGVAIYSKAKPDLVEYIMGVPELDKEGRLVTMYFGTTALMNVYFPNGGGGPNPTKKQNKFYQ